MATHNHAVVWIDHRVAKVFYLGLEATDESAVIHANLATEHLHHKANTTGYGNVLDDPTFFPRIDEALRTVSDPHRGSWKRENPAVEASQGEPAFARDARTPYSSQRSSDRPRNHCVGTPSLPSRRAGAVRSAATI